MVHGNGSTSPRQMAGLLDHSPDPRAKGTNPGNPVAWSTKLGEETARRWRAAETRGVGSDLAMRRSFARCLGDLPGHARQASVGPLVKSSRRAEHRKSICAGRRVH